MKTCRNNTGQRHQHHLKEESNIFLCPLQCDVPEGGLVPKSLYRTAEELESEENHLLSDSIYKSASIFKGAPYEVQSVQQILWFR